MKKKYWPLLVAVVVTMSGCGDNPEPPKHTSPPPGWRIMCNGHGHFAWQYPDNHSTVFDSDCTSYQMAVDKAWMQLQFEADRAAEEARQRVLHPSPDTVTWHECTMSN